MPKSRRKTFGQVITEYRKNVPYTLKELAQRIKKEDGEPISFQYLSDIENDRREAPPNHLIEEFHRVLKIPRDYLYLKALRLPPEVDYLDDEEVAVAAYETLRASLKTPVAKRRVAA